MGPLLGPILPLYDSADENPLTLITPRIIPDQETLFKGSERTMAGLPAFRERGLLSRLKLNFRSNLIYLRGR
jgi:hypothetical protein